MTSRILVYAHRYKRPSRKRKAVALEVPAIVTKARKHVAGTTRSDDATASPNVRSPDPTTEAATPANAQRKSAIVTTRRRKHAMHAHLLDGLTPEEVQRRGDAADALFREIVRRAMQQGR